MNDYFRNLPRKWMGSGALFFNSESKVLIVKPTYKDYWEIPGGSVENEESPWNACVREVSEELGLSVDGARLLSIDYVPNNDNKGDRIIFIYDGGTLTDEQIKDIRLPKDELSEYRFVTVEEAADLLGERLRRRVPNSVIARNKHATYYLENGEIITKL